MTPESMIEKALRLARDGRVTHDEGAAVYLVKGDTGTHTVIVYSTGHPWCTCRAPGPCSHMLAVAKSRVREQV